MVIDSIEIDFIHYDYSEILKFDFWAELHLATAFKIKDKKSKKAIIINFFLWVLFVSQNYLIFESLPGTPSHVLIK